MKGSQPSKSYQIMLLIGLVLVGFFIWRKRDAGVTPVSARQVTAQKAPQTIERVAVPSPAPPKRDIIMQRQLTETRLAIHAQHVPAKVEDDKIQISFRFLPQPRSCKDGDIDLISKVSGKNPKLLLSVQDDSNRVNFTKVLTPDDLRKAFPFKLELAKSAKPSVHNLALCMDQGNGACQGTLPFDFERYSATRLDHKADIKPNANLLFYSLMLVARQGRVDILDPLANAESTEYARYIRIAGGGDQQERFIESQLEQQRKMGPLPTRFDKTSVILPLYFNDKSQCSPTRKGGQIHAKQ